MRLMVFFLLIVIVSNCTTEADHTPSPSPKLNEQRYQVRSVDPPIVFTGASVMSGSDGNWPFMQIMTNDNIIYADLNFSNNINNVDGRRNKGLGPTFKFQILSNPKDNALARIEKTSIIMHGKQTQLIEDRYFGYFGQARDSVEIAGRDCLDCSLSVGSGLKCRVKCSSFDAGGSFKTIWLSTDDPIVEITKRANNGLYAITTSGKLLFIARKDAEVLPPKLLHSDLKFLPNSQGRFFINVPSIETCMKTDKREIYCAELSTRQSDSENYELTNKNPYLLKVDSPYFDVEEVAFGGRHYCFLSNSGEVWCKGDNGCGQITGRHDGKQLIDNLEKIGFLAKRAQQIFAHAGGTCALLIDGRVQCWGLGASVIRTRALPDSAYHKSFSWRDGYRPWQVCAGGAENGI